MPRLESPIMCALFPRLPRPFRARFPLCVDRFVPGVHFLGVGLCNVLLELLQSARECCVGQTRLFAFVDLLGRRVRKISLLAQHGVHVFGWRLCGAADTSLAVVRTLLQTSHAVRLWVCTCRACPDDAAKGGKGKGKMKTESLDNPWQSFLAVHAPYGKFAFPPGHKSRISS